jgi:ribosomal protein L28
MQRCIHNFGRKTGRDQMGGLGVEKRSNGRPRRRWEGNIKTKSFQHMSEWIKLKQLTIRTSGRFL